MSYIHPDLLGGASMLTHYVVSLRAKGHFLPDDEQRLLLQWLDLAGDADQLLVVLAEHLPPLFAKAKHKSQPPSLRKIDRKIQVIFQKT